MPRQFRRDHLNVHICESRDAIGQAAAHAAARVILDVLSREREAAVVFASARSQDEFLAHLRAGAAIPWERVVAFHLDEYVGLPADHPASFRRFLRDRLIHHVPIREFYELNGEAADLPSECARYAALLREKKPALVALGIGENGHLAFVDPHNCDFNDPCDVRVVELDDVCRMQQVHDGAFERVEDVPRRALTLTIPFFLRVPYAVVSVPGAAKRHAVQAALEGPVSEACPASALRRHPCAHLFLEPESAGAIHYCASESYCGAGR